MFKNIMRYRDSRTARNSNTSFHIWDGVNCFVITPSLFPCIFAVLLSLHHVTFLMFFSLLKILFLFVFICHFLVSRRCMLDLKFAIYHRTAKKSLTSRASSVDVTDPDICSSRIQIDTPCHTCCICISAILP